MLVLAVTLTLVSSSEGQGFKANSREVVFNSYDGVALSGTFYPSSSGKRQATVLILHDFDLKTGGSSTKEEGWSQLAAELQADGYAVLLFDFRGFGNSTTVEASTFWSPQFKNASLLRKPAKPETLTYKSFSPSYLPHLLHDIAAARAYLDRQNDQKNCNTSSLIVIGAGKGATLGALWMMHEGYLRRDRNNPPLLVPALGEPEARDLAAAVWLTMSPTIGTIRVPVSNALREISRDSKVPQLFVYGKGDANGQNFSETMLKTVKPNIKDKTPHLKLTTKVGINGTKLAGEKLLSKPLDTRRIIIKEYLEKVLEERREKEWMERKPTTSVYYYSSSKIRPRVAKPSGQEAPAVDLGLFGLNF